MPVRCQPADANPPSKLSLVYLWSTCYSGERAARLEGGADCLPYLKWNLVTHHRRSCTSLLLAARPCRLARYQEPAAQRNGRLARAAYLQQLPVRHTPLLPRRPRSIRLSCPDTSNRPTVSSCGLFRVAVSGAGRGGFCKPGLGGGGTVPVIEFRAASPAMLIEGRPQCTAVDAAAEETRGEGAGARGGGGVLQTQA